MLPEGTGNRTADPGVNPMLHLTLTHEADKENLKFNEMVEGNANHEYIKYVL